jgi:polyisoprenoid-binding protein YceI
MMVTSVSGHFERVTGTVNLDDKDPSRSADPARLIAYRTASPAPAAR